MGKNNFQTDEYQFLEPRGPARAQHIKWKRKSQDLSLKNLETAEKIVKYYQGKQGIRNQNGIGLQNSNIWTEERMEKCLKNIKEKNNQQNLIVRKIINQKER